MPKKYISSASIKSNLNHSLNLPLLSKIPLPIFNSLISREVAPNPSSLVLDIFADLNSVKLELTNLNNIFILASF